MRTDDQDDDNLGQIAYTAYVVSINQQGYTLPRYINLPMSVQENWQDVGEAIAKHLSL